MTPATDTTPVTMTIRRSCQRGYADHGWLKSHHSFSFAGYFDPQYMGWGNLRVVNEDRVAPGMGFGTHGHRDMEIISYVLSGELAHKDSMGNVVAIPPGDVQRMSAGTGVQHSEFNHAKDSVTHFLQIWIEPNVKGVVPSYEQTTFSIADKQGVMRLIASNDGQNGSVRLHADAKVYASLLDGEQPVVLTLPAGRKGYVQCLRGDVLVQGERLRVGDAALIRESTQAQTIVLAEAQDAEVLLFDLCA